jgi:hypothetical protein
MILVAPLLWLCQTPLGETRQHTPSNGFHDMTPSWREIPPPLYTLQLKSAAVLGHVALDREMCFLAFDGYVIRHLSQPFML